MTEEANIPVELIECRFVVGIDLGTTNVSVSYVDLEGEPDIEQFAIPQLVAAGEVAARDLLPSCCYLPMGPELPPGALSLPWSDAVTHAVGAFAREQGTGVPERLVSSAKSWLAHAGVDRRRGILPWGSDIGEQKVSPVRVSQWYLEHVRAAWDHCFGHLRDRHGTAAVLSEQHVILTVPASFDEVARQLTVEAARAAGLEHVTLIEEPLAAFYAWLSRHEDAWRESLAEGESVLVVDVGGGTSDFSLVAVEAGFVLRRMAVGDHLLLGGDNMDMALARMAEQAWGTKLEPRQWHALCQHCRAVKETLLAEDAPVSVQVGLAGSGSSVVASMRSHIFERETVVQAMLEGFFPSISVTAPPPERRRGMREMGLPYAADPGLTRHLLDFLKKAAPVMGGTADTPVIPSAILFNGGAMLPAIIRRRLCEQIGAWGGGGPIRELRAVDLNLAVSRGAAYYGRVRHGHGVRVKGGLARAYYLEVHRGEESGLLCVMPRDSEEGRLVRLEGQRLTVLANQPVRFPLASSATRLGDRPGALLAAGEDVTHLPALHTTLRYGRGRRTELEVILSARLNAVGTLDIGLEAVDSGHVYPLVFDLRAEVDQSAAGAGVTVTETCLRRAEERLREVFAGAAEPRSLLRELEEDLALPRAEWNLSVLRRFADGLLALESGAGRTPRHEARWLNLTGYCLRPGFGAPGDEWRSAQLWKRWHGGPVHSGQAQVAAEWWVLWRRLAAGLRSGHQEQIAGRLVRDIVPKAGEKLRRGKRLRQDEVEKWRCLGALERLSPKRKERLLSALLASGRGLDDCHLWVIGRLGARTLFHGPADAVIPPEKLLPHLHEFMQRFLEKKASRMALFALVNMARFSGIRGLDLPAVEKASVVACLQRHQAPSAWMDLLDRALEEDNSFTAELVGDRLPLGLTVNACIDAADPE